MLKSGLLALAAALLTAALLPAAAHATTISENFTYSGTGTYTAGETATGIGSVTFNVTTIGAGTLTNITAFSFSDTLTTLLQGSSTFTYGLADLKSSSEVFGGTLASPSLATINLLTNYKAGTNATFGNVDFNLVYSAVTNDSTGATGASFLPDFTSGGGTLTLVPTVAAPEPSSLLLLGTGLAGVGMLFTRRRATTAPASAR